MIAIMTWKEDLNEELKLGLDGSRVADSIEELEDEKGLLLEGDNPNHLIFVVDYAAWRYQSKDSSGDMPRHLQFRMHNMFIHTGR